MGLKRKKDFIVSKVYGGLAVACAGLAVLGCVSSAHYKKSMNKCIDDYRHSETFLQYIEEKKANADAEYASKKIGPVEYSQKMLELDSDDMVKEHFLRNADRDTLDLYNESVKLSKRNLELGLMLTPSPLILGLASYYEYKERKEEILVENFIK